MADWYEESGQQRVEVDATREPPSAPGLVGAMGPRGLRAAPDPTRANWAIRPRLVPIGDRDVEVHFIASLACALGVSAVTVRRWERAGLFPIAALFLEQPRLPNHVRLYTTPMVHAVARLAVEWGVGRRHLPTKGFAHAVLLEWADEMPRLGLAPQATVVRTNGTVYARAQDHRRVPVGLVDQRGFLSNCLDTSGLDSRSH